MPNKHNTKLETLAKSWRPIRIFWKCVATRVQNSKGVWHHLGCFLASGGGRVLPRPWNWLMYHPAHPSRNWPSIRTVQDSMFWHYCRHCCNGPHWTAEDEPPDQTFSSPAICCWQFLLVQVWLYPCRCIARSDEMSWQNGKWATKTTWSRIR